MSAEHGEGMGELAILLAPLINSAEEESIENAPIVDLDLVDGETLEEYSLPTVQKPMQVAVIGRPNAGKSTLINTILGEDRLLTGPEAGITRDAISLTLDWGGIPTRIFDTAGMRKKAKVQEKLEKLSINYILKLLLLLIRILYLITT